MNKQKFIQIYLRKTNGSGEKIFINYNISIHQLYNICSKCFKFKSTQFDLYFKGDKLPNNQKCTLIEYNITQGSIIHLQQKIKIQQQNFVIRVFYKGQLYTYKTNKKNLIYSLKQYLVNIIHCLIDDITISYIGRILQDHENFQENSIKNYDLLSVTLANDDDNKMEELKIQAKLVESVTFSSSEVIDKQLLKMNKKNITIKSTQHLSDLKNNRQKNLLGSQRIKSQKAMKQSGKQSEEHFKFQGFHRNRIIQTQSITLDDPDFQEEDQQWNQCFIQFINPSKNQQYIIQCNDNHNIVSVVNVLANKLRRKPSQFMLIFEDQSLQRMVESGKMIVEIAKVRNTKIITNVIFK